MAEFPNLGVHCAVERCCRLDFLPFQCDACKMTYCLEHRQPSDHQCSNSTSIIIIEEKIQSAPTLSRCSLIDCKNRELVDIVCKHCNENFCLHHRHQQDHGCIALPPKDSRESKTSTLVRSILETNLASRTEETRRPQGGKSSSKLSAQVNLMKIKMTAIGDKGLPPDERVYLTITIDPKDAENDMSNVIRTKSFYFSKTWSVGRIVDHVAAIEKLRNMNNVSGAKKLLLFAHDDGDKPLAMDACLAELISQNVLRNGDTVSLKYRYAE